MSMPMWVRDILRAMFCPFDAFFCPDPFPGPPEED